MPLSKLSKAYFAGFIDGEGTIGVYPRRSVNRCHITILQISQVDKRPLKILHNEYGGGLRLFKGTGNQRDAWKFTVSGIRAFRLLTDIAPYLIVKKAQATLILSNWYALSPRKGGRHKRLRVTDEIHKRRREISYQ